MSENNDSEISTEEKIRIILDAMTEVLVEKNRRYGDSAINPKKIFSNLDGKEGIKIRLDDKIGRVMNSDDIRINDVCDMIGYLALYLIADGVKSDDIIKLID